MRTIFKSGQKFGSWTAIAFLGSGGNGEVWECQNLSGDTRAIKLLKNVRPKSYLRFLDETKVIEENSDIQGIIPIEEKFLPVSTDDQVPFYLMPLAETSEGKLINAPIEEKIHAVISIAKTLSQLHKRQIFHRDIKPGNILYYNSRYCLADFGLVDFPNKKDVSLRNEEIGAKWTMAPEMRRESSSADLAKADIYSLAKTLWIFLTGRNKGFDGQYSTESIIDLKKFYPNSYTSPLDNLLIACTDNDPVKRLSLEKFIEALEAWGKLDQNFHKRNQQQWFEIQMKLFPTSIPKRVIWEDTNDIIKVLKIVCSFTNLNHVFFPNSGGLDLKDVGLSYEEDCIELDFGSVNILNPKRLIFESFGFEHQWNYFRLELNPLEPTDLNNFGGNENSYELETGRESLSELSPGNYYPYEILENRYYFERDYLITNFSRRVTRWLRGSFVIFGKRSTYNLTPSTYDGRHNKMTADEFRDYIQKMVNKMIEEEEKENNFLRRFLKNREEQSPKLKHFIEEETIYRCGWCGKIVSSEGNEPDEHTRNYNIKIIEKFGDGVVRRVEGNCCKGKRH